MDERKAAILHAVVEEYIHTAEPVGSGTVAAATGIGVSPATIRNEMVQLEQQGYLQQPHTSAGRVPTDKGYRFFVDALREDQPTQLSRTESRTVRAFFDQAHGEIESMLHDTSRLLADLTNYAAVVVGPGVDASTVRSVQLVGLAPQVVLVVLVLANGQVEKRTLELEFEPDDAQVAAAQVKLAAALEGTTLGAARVAPSGDDRLDQLLAAAVEALQPTTEEPVFVGGRARMAQSFDAVDQIREVLTILEKQLVVVSLLRDVLDRGLQVAIGAETRMEPLTDCAVVVAPYDVDGETVGTVGVLGPARMNYPQAMAAVAVVSNQLGNRLTEG